MKSNIRGKAKGIAWLFCLVYFASYIMRINYAVMMLNIGAELGLPKSALAIAVTCLTVSYGVGQVVSGFLGDRIPPQLLIATGLGLATVCNVLMFFCPSVLWMSVVWGVNGVAHALLWPPIVRMMSMHLTEWEYPYASVRVSWGSSFATILLYLVCPLLLKALTWRTVMLCCAACGVGVLAIFLLLSPKLFSDPINAPKRGAGGSIQRIPLPKFVWLPTILIMVGIVLQGTLRDGVTNWMPFYLLESFGLPEDKAIISTVILAVFSVISFALFDFLHRAFFRNEVFCAAVIFGGSTVSAGLLLLVNALFSSPIPSMLCMALIVSCMHGINLMLITVCPKRFAKSGKVASFSGMLNACTYVGAAIGSSGFAFLAERFDWGITILSWVLISALGTGILLFATPIWHRFRQEYSDKP